MIGTWNAKQKVTLMRMTKTEICGAQTVSEGHEDFIACAVVPSKERTVFTHKGIDLMIRPMIYVDLPKRDVRLYDGWGIILRCRA